MQTNELISSANILLIKKLFREGAQNTRLEILFDNIQFCKFIISVLQRYFKNLFKHA